MERAQQLIATLPPRYPVDERNLPIALTLLATLHQQELLPPACRLDGDDEGSIYCLWPDGYAAFIVNQGYVTVERLNNDDNRADEAWDFSAVAVQAVCNKVREIL